MDDIIKKFDEKFAQILHIHRGECAITDITGTKWSAHTDENGKVTEVGGLESIKDFIRETLTTHTTTLMEKVEAMRKPQLDKNDPDNYGACYAIAGFNDCLDKVKALLSEAVKK